MHIPQRMCIACRRMKPKGELVKIVREEHTAVLDENQNKFGRGAYLCKNEVCIASAKKRRLLSKHFKMQVDEALYDEISEAAQNG